jgi:hypothetical protein
MTSWSPMMFKRESELDWFILELIPEEHTKIQYL